MVYVYMETCFVCFFLVLQVAEYSVDSLKQLALKFVCKEELRDFNFQRLFLCPFESVFVATQHKDIKVLILDCLQNLVQVSEELFSFLVCRCFSVSALGISLSSQSCNQHG